MTVVLALRCTDGVVIGSDSQITDSGRGISFPGEKLHPLGARAAWGGSGARSVLRELHGVLEESADAIVDAPDVAHALQERILPVLRHHYANYIPDVPGSADGPGPSAYVLAAGMTDGQPWIIQVDPHAMVSRYEDIGFDAIGSGAPMAQQAWALLGHFRMVQRPVDYGILAVVRVLDALTVTSPSVGGPLDVSAITAEGARSLGEDEIDEVHALVGRWRERELEALDGLFDARR